MITAGSITDEQIQHLLCGAYGKVTPILVADCEHALLKRDRHWTRYERNRQRSARIRVAEVLNGRIEAAKTCDCTVCAHSKKHPQLNAPRCYEASLNARPTPSATKGGV